LRVGDRIIPGSFIPDVLEMAIPPAAGIGDIIELVEVDVETGFGQDARLSVIVIIHD